MNKYQGEKLMSWAMRRLRSRVIGLGMVYSVSRHASDMHCTADLIWEALSRCDDLGVIDTQGDKVLRTSLVVAIGQEPELSTWGEVEERRAKAARRKRERDAKRNSFTKTVDAPPPIL